MTSIFSPTLDLQGHTFFPSPLNRTSTVVDLGANRGEFSRRVLQRFQCRCIAVEPNPSLVDRIRALPGIEVAWAAVGDSDRQIELYLSDNSEASTALLGSIEANGKSVQVPMCSLENLLKRFGITRADLMKVDIEGSEVATILSAPDCVLQSIDQISVEFHDFCRLVTLEQVLAVYSRLERLNFYAIEFGPGRANTLFVRRDVAGIGGIRRTYAKHILLNLRAASHMVRRVSRRMLGYTNPLSD